MVVAKRRILLRGRLDIRRGPRGLAPGPRPPSPGECAMEQRDPNAHEAGSPAAGAQAFVGLPTWWPGDRFIRVVAGVTVFLVVLALGSYWPGWAVQAEARRFRAAGLPVTLEELNAWYPTPEGANAADVYARAFEAYVRSEAAERELPGIGHPDRALPPRGEPLPLAMVEAIETYLTQNADAVRLLREATSIEGCRFPVDFAESDDMNHLHQLRHGARLLQLEAVLRAHRGQADAALESVAVMLQLGDSLTNEPTVGSQAVRRSLDAYACLTLEWVIASRTFSDRSLSDISDALTSKDYYQDMVRAIAGSQCLQLRQAPDYDIIGDDEKLLRLLGLSSVATLVSLQATFRFIEANRGLTAPSPDWEDYTDNSWRRNLQAVSLRYAVTSILERAERMDVTRVGVAVKRYELATGRLPGQLADLVQTYLDAVPVSPFDGKPLRWRATETGLIVYGPGDDGQDNGGIGPEEDDPWRMTDTIFAVDRLAAPPDSAEKETQ